MALSGEGAIEGVSSSSGMNTSGMTDSIVNSLADDKSSAGPNTEGLAPGTKVAPGKVVNENGEVEDSATKKALKAGATIAAIAATAGAGASVAGATTGATTAGTTASASAAATNAAKSTATAAPKGAGAGNRNFLNSGNKPGIKNNPLMDKAKQKVGKTVDNVVGKVSDTLEKNEAIKKVAEKLENASDTVNSGASAIANAKNGNFKEAVKDGKKALKSGKKTAKDIKSLKMKLMIIGIAGGMFGFLLIIVIFILTFTSGFKKLGDFGYEDGSSGGTSGGMTSVPTLVSGQILDEQVLSIINGVENYSSLSPSRQRFVIAAALAVGKPYKEGVKPTSASVTGLSGGVDAGGMVEWVYWNATRIDIGDLSPSIMTNLMGFMEIDSTWLTPGDYGINGDDIAIYMGNNQWVHVDPSSGVIVLSDASYTDFWRFKEIENIATLTIEAPPKGKLEDVFPNGVPNSEAAMQEYLTTIQVPTLDKNGQTHTTTLTVHKAVAEDLKIAYQQMYDAGFKVYSTYCYSWRNIANSSSRSHHSYGLACDINPKENYCYYVNNDGGVGSICYEGWWKPGEDEYSMPADGVAVQSFYSIGWSWGGDWHTKKDYMHFSYTGN